MKPKIVFVQSDADNKISLTKEELETLLGEAYEEGKRDAEYYWYRPYWIYTTTDSTGTPYDKWSITVSDHTETNNK